MKNKEKYYDEILQIVIEEGTLAVDKNTNKPINCRVFICDDCLFNNWCVNKSRKEWLEPECQEPIKLTDDEIVILKNIDKNYHWIAKNGIGNLFVYKTKPLKNGTTWQIIDNNIFSELYVFKNLFQFIKWSDKEPYEIDELLKQNGAER